MRRSRIATIVSVLAVRTTCAHTDDDRRPLAKQATPVSEMSSRAWRRNLCRELISLQNKDGCWISTADRWYEGNPMLLTAYAVLALQTALA